MGYKEIGYVLGELVDIKNKAYGDSFRVSATILEILYPNGIAVNQYDDMLALIRVFDKMMRIATDKDALGESPWADIGGYSLLMIGQNSDIVGRLRSYIEEYEKDTQSELDQRSA